MPLIPRAVEVGFNRALDRIARTRFFSRLSPNLVSTVGILVGIVPAFLFAYGEFVLAGIFMIISGVLDMLDGKIARASGRTTVFGALYDATVDRATELAIYTGIGAYFILRNMHLTSLFVVFAAGGSWLVSYVRARAESFGVPCEVGLLRRGERFFLLSAGAILSFAPEPFHEAALWFLDVVKLKTPYAYPPMPLTICIILIAILAQITIVQRLVHVWKSTRPSDL